jgi:hypothetical protein
MAIVRSAIGSADRSGEGGGDCRPRPIPPSHRRATALCVGRAAQCGIHPRAGKVPIVYGLALPTLGNALGRLLESGCRTLQSPKQPAALGTACLELPLMHGTDQAPDHCCCIPQHGAMIRQEGPFPPARASSLRPTLPVKKGEYLLRQSAGSGVISESQQGWCVAGGGGDTPTRDTPVIAVPVLLGTGSLQEKDEQGVAVLFHGEGNNARSVR